MGDKSISNWHIVLITAITLVIILILSIAYVVAPPVLSIYVGPNYAYLVAIGGGLVFVLFFFAALAQLLGYSVRDFVKPRAPVTTRSQAMRSIPYFIGRRIELDRLEKILKPRNNVKTVAIVGVPGVGKTELARKIAEKVFGNYADGLLWTDCSSEHSIDLADRWVYDLGRTNTGRDLTTKTTCCRDVLTQKETLLIFDEILDGKDLKALIPATGRSTVLLITSITDHPLITDHFILGKINRKNISVVKLRVFTLDEAMQLAERILSEKDLAPQREQAKILFAHLGYIPALIYVFLTSAKSNSLGPSVDLASLNQQLEKSYVIHLCNDPALQKISDTLRKIWVQYPELRSESVPLAVFSKSPGFSLAAAASVLGTDDRTTLHLLTKLENKSLLISNIPNRWFIHPLLCDFIANMVSSDDPVWERKAKHYVAQMKKFCDLYNQGYEDEAMKLYNLDKPNITAVINAKKCEAETKAKLKPGNRLSSFDR